jgi:phytoene synthase
MDLDQAYTYCLNITKNHYENFPVASRLIPKSHRKYITAIYAFARTADDFADEEKDKEKLLQWREKLFLCKKNKVEHPIFLALANTIRKFDLPINWLDDLLSAFLIDLEKNRFQNFNDLIKYSKYSANPVGRIILWMFNYRSDDLMMYSDAITTALQLTNFWQDVSDDIKRNKIYIPLKHFEKYMVEEKQLQDKKYTSNLGFLLDDLIQRTEELYEKGYPLTTLLKGRLRWEVGLTVAGGLKILEKVANNKEMILYCRPKLTKIDWLKILQKFII